jgi:hypothetical protein
MSNVLKMLSRGGAAAAETDPNFKQTVLLLHGDGTNGAQNNTFLDSSTNNFTITRNPANGPNAPTQGTFSPFSVGAGEWSNYFDGSNDRLSVADNALFNFDGAFTVEAWVYRTVGSAEQAIVAKWGYVNDAWLLRIEPGNVLKFFYENASITTTASVPVNEWFHVAVTRDSSNDIRVFLNGTQTGSTANNSINITNTSPVYIGAYEGISSTIVSPLTGYISNVRIIKGSALYTSNFTPSTVPLTTTSQGASSSEVELLTCQSNRFVDNSSNAFAITRNGDVRVTPFSPFAPSAAYSAGTNGGSGYFDGTGDYLATPTLATIGAGEFSQEAWVYAQANSGTPLLWDAGAAAGTFLLLNGSTSLLGGINGSVALTATYTLPLNSWTHLVYCRSGTTLSIFANGSRIGTGTVSTSAGSASYNIGIAKDVTRPFTGYMCGVRFVHGSSAYDATQSTITIPTSPPTAITNTSLLLNFTNAGIFDQTGKNNLETVGNAQIDTTTKKFGTGSMEFDENGDYLTLPSTIDVAFGTGNFTIEMWARFAVSTVGNGQGLFQLSNGYLNSQVRGPAAGCDNETGRWAIYHGTSQTTHGSLVPSTNTWYHVAYVRNSGTTKLYIDGTEIISVADTTNYTDTNFTIAGWYSSGFLLNGFIDDLRITKGVARYPTEPFPTAPFPDL